MRLSPARVANRWVEAGLLKPPPAILRAIEAWALGQFGGHVLGVLEDWERENRKIAPPEQLIEYALVQKEARKYAKGGKVQKGKAAKTFPLDFRGWSYVRGDAQWDYDQGTEVDVTMFFGSPYLDLGGWKYTGEGDTFGHIWLDAFRYLEDLEDSYWELRVFKESVKTLSETVYHEVSHLGQAALTVLHDTAELAGLPGVKWRGKQYKDVKDFLDDEFYPRLRDEVEVFTRTLRRVPKRKWRDAFDDWSRRSGILGTAYELDKRKWRKAVSEFYKAVIDKGYEI